MAPEETLTYHLTQPETILNLAVCQDLHRTTTTAWTVSISDFVLATHPPVETSRTKEGRGFLTGPCFPTRAKRNLPWSCVAVIDADKTLLPEGTEEDGAPLPQLVANELRRNNLTFILYTTWSHGTGRGNRYRIVIPIPLANEQEMAALVTFYVEILQGAGIPLALSRESSVWSQVWALPRTAGNQSPYEHDHHFGVVPNPTQLARLYGLLDDEGNPRKSTLPPIPQEEVELQKTGHSWIWMFNRYYPVELHLQTHHYTLVSQAIQYSETGEAQAVKRYRKPPKSGDGPDSNAPGVIVFEGPTGARVYSHHQNDVLANGHANDAFAAWSLLNGLSSQDALSGAILMIQDAIAEEMNSEYPSVMEGYAKFKIGNRYTDDLGAEAYAYMAWADFKMSQANGETVPYEKQDEDGGRRRVAFSERSAWWLQCRNRIQYNGLVYEPCSILETPERDIYRRGGRKERPYFNTFRGWGAKPFKGKWPHLEWHLRNAYFSGDKEQYEYYLDWCAHLVQYPQEKPGVAVALTGRKGWGKSAPQSLLAKKLGSNAVVIGNQKLLTGQFNGHLRSKLFVLLEEAFWTGNRQNEGPLKHLITDDWTMYEKKGHDAVSGASYVRVMMLTNDEWVAPATKDERRFFLPTMCSASKDRDEESGRKGSFFPQLFNEMENGGMEAFLWDMAHRPVSRTQIVNVPETVALKNQRALTLQGMESWMLTCLTTGQIRSEKAGTSYSWGMAGCTVPEEHLLDSMSSSLSRFDMERNIGYRLQQILSSLLGPLATRRENRWTFGSIVECRKEFAEALKLPDNMFCMNPGSSSFHRETEDNVIQLNRT